MAQLHSLADEGLLQDGQLAFVVADGYEVELVRALADDIGRDLADGIETAWPQLEACSPLPVEEYGFLLVGDLLLDQALLEALALDGSLMPPAPQRRSGRYYAWLVEGGREAAGHYGQRLTQLSESRALLTFGRYERPDREALHENGDVAGLVSFDTDDLATWEAAALQVARSLTDVFPRRELHVLTQRLRCRPSLGALACWVDHLAFAHAIDLLAERGRFPVPPSGWTAAVIEIGGGPGVFA